MASSVAKIAAVLCVFLLLSAAVSDAASIRGRELKATQITIAGCRGYGWRNGRQVCTACTTGYLFVPGDGGCVRQTTTVVRGPVRPVRGGAVVYGK